MLPTKPWALPQADLLWPVGPNRSVSVGFQEFVALCGLPHFRIISASPSHPRFLTRALHFAQTPQIRVRLYYARLTVKQAMPTAR